MTRKFLISFALLTFCVSTALATSSPAPEGKQVTAIESKLSQAAQTKETSLEQRLTERNHKKRTRLQQQLNLAKSVTLEHMKSRKRATADIKKEKFILFTNHLASIESLLEKAPTYTKPEIQGLAYSLCEKQLNMILKMVDPKALKALRSA